MTKHGIIWLLLFLNSGCAFLLPSQRITFRNQVSPPKYLRGAFHVHSIFSNDSKATLNGIIDYAKESDLDFVIVTDHNTTAGMDVYSTMERPEVPILIFGNEISTRDGHLIALGIRETPPPDLNSERLIDWIHGHGGFAVIAHPLSTKRPWTNWELQGVDGIEVFNFGHSLYAKKKIQLIGTSLFFWPNAFVKKHIETSGDTLSLWDSQLLKNRVSGLAATDAHLKLVDAPIFRGLFRQALRSATLYVVSEQLNEKAIIRNLVEGNSFSVFESLGVVSDFSFKAITGNKSYHSGQTVKAHLPLTFFIRASGANKIHLVCNGKVIKQIDGESLKFLCNEAGAYRVEIFRKKRLWIISNPIYVERF